MNPGGRRFTTADALIWFNGLSAFGSGLVYPYTALYFSGHPGIGAAGVGIYYGASAAANLATTAVLATGRVRTPPVVLGLVGTLMLATGFLGTATAASQALLAVAVVFIGCGQGCLLVAMVPVLTALIPVDQRRTVFARRYRAINLGLGLGAVVAGTATGVLALSVVPWLFVCNALSYLPLAYAFHRIRGHRAATAESTAEAAAGETAGDRWRWLWGAGALAVAFQLGAYMFGHSQFEATAPLVAVDLMGIGLATVSGLLLVNTGVVVFAQSWVTKALSGRSEAFGLRVTVVLWALAYATAALAAFGDLPVRYAGLAVFAVVFALGECAYSCSFHPWLIGSVDQRHMTRMSALASGAMGVGTAVGPSVGVALTLLGDATAVWMSLASFCLLLLCTIHTRRAAATERRTGEKPASLTGGSS
jgi:predicted MFS family arabinose efflux permease